MKSTLIAHQINVLSDRVKHAVPDSAPTGIPCTAKIRYNHQPQPATLFVTDNDEIKVVFNEPQSAVTPGQAVVLFDGDIVLGGGWIDSAE
jgi:tRNA U34 2-thiouridine synthase MnmA/TrmU